ncbi:MAG TPA: DUF2232 domain-containing protein [Ktedonobacteraceae bacterium]|nr:DUF2232 domain-containing protein [Ktedonobacteraceae bacterium]
MLRKLSAIELAEGALLADIAVVFQLLVKFLPVGGGFFALLVPPLFAILVLRRGFYAGVMSVCVALFIVGVTTGLGSLVLMLMEAGAGVFLGITMKYRLHYIPLIVLGTIGGTIAIVAQTLLSVLLIGQGYIDILVQSFRLTFQGIFSLLNFVTPQIGLGLWWQHSYPGAQHLADQALTNWFLVLCILDLLFMCPVVIVIYYITTFLVRLLGYDVLPFPTGWLNRLLRWLTRLLIFIALKIGLGKFWPTRSLIKEIRRQYMGLGRQKTTL